MTVSKASFYSTCFHCVCSLSQDIIRGLVSSVEVQQRNNLLAPLCLKQCKNNHSITFCFQTGKLWIVTISNFGGRFIKVCI